MIRVEAGGVVFEVEAVAFDKDGTLIDLDSAWGPAARHWVEAAAAGDLDLAKDLASSLGLDVDTGRLLIDGPFAVGTVRALYETEGVGPSALARRFHVSRQSGQACAPENGLGITAAP